eukprot:6491642-Amphidinium_carterae.8
MTTCFISLTAAEGCKRPTMDGGNQRISYGGRSSTMEPSTVEWQGTLGIPRWLKVALNVQSLGNTLV